MAMAEPNVTPCTPNLEGSGPSGQGTPGLFSEIKEFIQRIQIGDDVDRRADDSVRDTDGNPIDVLFDLHAVTVELGICGKLEAPLPTLTRDVNCE